MTPLPPVPRRRRRRLLTAAATGLAVGLSTLVLGAGVGPSSAEPVAPAALPPGSPVSPGSDFARELESKYVDPDRVYSADVRWWLGEASHTDESLLEEIQNLYDYGFRGVELAMQGDNVAPDTTYGYGTDMWAHKWDLMMNKLLDLGMGVYLTSGTYWATSNVPGLDPDSQAAMQNLTMGTSAVAPGEAISVLPTPAATVQKAAAKFVTAYAYRVVEGDTLDPDSFVDLSQQLTQGASSWTQNLSWTAPSDGSYRVFAIWTQGTYQTASPSALPSYATNYFDERGVGALRAFWEEHYLKDPALNAKIKQGDVQLFMDSLEINPGGGPDNFTPKALTPQFTYWAEDMAEEFRARKGYDITPYLFLIHGVKAFVGSPYHSLDATGTWRIEGENRRREGIINDYQDVLTQLYRERMLDPMKEWLNGVGIKTRAQISYVRPFEISEPTMSVDFPEVENFNQYNQIEMYRLHSGGAKLENKVLSSETGAQIPAYNGTAQRDVQDAYSEFAAGIQRVIWHVYGAGYSYGNTAWPGHNPTGFRHYGSRHPNSADYDEWNAHIGRVQQLLQTGKSRTDVGFVHQNWTQGFRFGGGMGNDNTQMQWQMAHQGIYYRSTELQDNGYTYDYFSPRFLFDDDVTFDEQTKRIEKAGYKAVVIYQKWLDLQGAERILDWAKKGLKVVFLEDAGRVTPLNDGQDAKLKAVVDEMKTLPTVRTAQVFDTPEAGYFSPEPGGYDDNVMEKLQELGVEPTVGYSEPNLQLLTQTRQDEDGNEFVYAYNYDDGSYLQNSHKPEVRAATHTTNITTDIVKDGQFVPYEIDAWSGEVTELADYQWVDGKTVLPIDLDYNNIKLYAFEKADAARLHVLETDGESAYTDGSSVKVRTSQSGTVKTTLSDGTTHTDDVSVPQPYDIRDWDLTVESWRPNATPGDLVRTETIGDVTTTNKKTSTVKTNIEVDLDELTTWDKIPQVGKAVSGTGHYEATFEWDADSASGAYLDFGPTLESSMKVWVNGRKVGGSWSKNPTKAKRDVGGLGKPTIDDGRGNQVRLVGKRQYTGGISWTKPEADISEYLVDGENTITIDYHSVLSNVQLDRGVIRELFPYLSYMDKGWWRNDQKYLSFGPSQAVVVPFVDVAYSARSAARLSAAPVRGTYGKPTTIVVQVAGDKPSGTVTVREGARVLGTASVAAGRASVRLAGTALTAGARTLQATYSGDAANGAATGRVPVAITKARTRMTTKVTPSRVRADRRARLTVTVAAAGVRPAGVVTVRHAGKVVARGRLDAAGKVTVKLPQRKRGYRVVVAYPGGANVTAVTQKVKVRIKK